MTWVKLDDRFPDNPKVAGLSADAAWLYVRGLCYCAAHLTDGVLSADVLVHTLRGKRRSIEELVRRDLWHELQSGSVVVHDYLEYNPARAKVEAQRKATAERVGKHRRGGGGSGGGGHGHGHGHDPEGNATVTPLQPRCSNGPVTPPPSRPVPSPDQIPPVVPPDGGKRAASARRRRWRKVPEDWEPKPEATALARKLGVDLAIELAKFRDHEFATAKSDPDATFRNWLRTAAERGPRGSPSKAPGLVDHEARRIEANTRQQHRAWLLEQAKDGVFGPGARESAQAGSLNLDRLEAWYEQQRKRRAQPDEAGSGGATQAEAGARVAQLAAGVGR